MKSQQSPDIFTISSSRSRFQHQKTHPDFRMSPDFTSRNQHELAAPWHHGTMAGTSRCASTVTSWHRPRVAAISGGCCCHSLEGAGRGPHGEINGNGDFFQEKPANHGNFTRKMLTKTYGDFT